MGLPSVSYPAVLFSLFTEGSSSVPAHSPSRTLGHGNTVPTVNTSGKMTDTVPSALVKLKSLWGRQMLKK